MLSRLLGWYVVFMFVMVSLIIIITLTTKYEAHGAEREAYVMPLCRMLNDGENWPVFHTEENTRDASTYEYTSQRGQKLRILIYKQRPVYFLMDLNADGLYELQVYSRELIEYCHSQFLNKG